MQQIARQKTSGLAMPGLEGHEQKRKSHLTPGSDRRIIRIWINILHLTSVSFHGSPPKALFTPYNG